MGLEALIGLVGIIVASVISVWTYRKMNPKRQLRYRADVTPLLTAHGGAHGRLTVALDGRPVTNPQVVELSLWSSGRADIGSQLFDAGKPLTFDLGALILDSSPASDLESARLVVGLPNTIRLYPALLHRKFQSSIRVVVDGTPNVTVNRVLPDIDVIQHGASETERAISTSRKRFRLTPLVAWTGLLILGVVVMAVGVVLTAVDYGASLPWGVTGMLIIMVALVAILVIAIYRGIRWLKRVIEARSGLR
ncbi:hypothetical protein [Microbacterium sp.]|uniref:hypothetical protein n=1 Tax=Microbacterium sp. TaxID=51671 RepID=UPI003F9E1BE7